MRKLGFSFDVMKRVARRVWRESGEDNVLGAAAELGYYFLLARFYEGEGKVDEAVDALKQGVTIDPKNAEVRAELAALFARQDRAREAVDAAEQALAIDPRNREANRVLGSVLAASFDQKKVLRSGEYG